MLEYGVAMKISRENLTNSESTEASRRNLLHRVANAAGRLLFGRSSERVFDRTAPEAGARGATLKDLIDEDVRRSSAVDVYSLGIGGQGREAAGVAQEQELFPVGPNVAPAVLDGHYAYGTESRESVEDRDYPQLVHPKAQVPPTGNPFKDAQTEALKRVAPAVIGGGPNGTHLWDHRPNSDS